jgi:MoaA/NifB/PqqE/SkfB family radical SAM enzyme
MSAFDAPGEADFGYDVEADWHPLLTCNFRCTYCFFPSNVLGQKLQIFASNETWRAAFAATGKRWLIHITGGEPTIYPKFVDLCDGLTQDHLISLNTNLSNPCVFEFARRINPQRVSFINAGLHIDERRRRRGVDVFIAHARAVQDAGFRIIPTIVATPAVVAELPDLTAQFAAEGLWLTPKVLRGGFKGRQYPQAYGAETKSVLRAAILEARDHYEGRFSGAGAMGRPSIDVFSDDELLTTYPTFTGQPCSAGSKFVRIRPNGDVFRCSEKTPLGNLLRGTMQLTSGPTPCDTKYCVYFCKKYTAHAAASMLQPPLVHGSSAGGATFPKTALRPVPGTAGQGRGAISKPISTN